jgi:hypothetical protein
MGRLIAFPKPWVIESLKPLAWLKRYWLVIYACLALICLFGVPQVCFRWPEAFYTATRGLTLGGLGGLGLWAVWSFSSHERRRDFRAVVRLIITLKYSLIFGLLLFYLPLTTCNNFPLHSLLGGLFVELDLPTVFIVSIFMSIAMWGLAFTQGIMVDGIETRFLIQGKARASRGKYIYEEGYIPKWAYHFFNSEIRWRQLGVYFLPMLLGIGIIVHWANANGILALLSAFGGLVTGLLIIAVLTSPGFINRKDDYSPLPYHLPHVLQQRVEPLKVKALSPFEPFISKAGKAAAGTPPASPAAASTDAPWWFPTVEHWVSLGIGLLVAGLILFGWLRVADPNFHPLSHLYILIIFLIFFISMADFQLARLRVSFSLVLLLWILIGYHLLEVDHYYDVKAVQTETIKALSPVDVARTSRAKENLVVVASTGGGIWAAAWTDTALQGLIAERKELLHEIRLLSTVSGSSVGAAFYLHDLCQTKDDLVAASAEQRADFLAKVRDKSAASSLSAVTYGVTFMDIFRLLTGGLISRFMETDRAMLQEARWASIAAGDTAKSDSSQRCDTLLNLRAAIRTGRVPAPIFNATTLESGRRVMITPINFDSSRWAYSETRGDTLSELLFGRAALLRYGQPMTEADVSLWTAVRLSAAFPYVTPAARARLQDGAPAGLEARSFDYHLIDGGYYDNFGVAAALDWLQPVLEARRRGDKSLEFTKVTIIELRAFPLPRRNCYQSTSGVSSALIGPPLGIYNIRTGAAFSRNEIEVERFMASWQAMLKDQGVRIKRYILEPPQLVSGSSDCVEENPAGPLSWHLTGENKASLQDQWQAVVTSGRLIPINKFLASK